jgi:hypothetical protein
MVIAGSRRPTVPHATRNRVDIQQDMNDLPTTLIRKGCCHCSLLYVLKSFLKDLQNMPRAFDANVVDGMSAGNPCSCVTKSGLTAIML